MFLIDRPRASRGLRAELAPPQLEGDVGKLIRAALVVRPPAAPPSAAPSRATPSGDRRLPVARHRVAG